MGFACLPLQGLPPGFRRTFQERSEGKDIRENLVLKS